MSGATVIVVVALLVVVLLVVGATVAVMSTHLKHLAGVLREVRTDVEPELERLQAATEVTQAELDRVSIATAELRDQRAERARGDGRPRP